MDAHGPDRDLVADPSGRVQIAGRYGRRHLVKLIGRIADGRQLRTQGRIPWSGDWASATTDAGATGVRVLEQPAAMSASPMAAIPGVERRAIARMFTVSFSGQ
jgi:hypothetical protein